MSTETKRHLLMLQAIAEAIRELGTVPAGTLYGHLMGHFASLDAFNSAIGVLIRAGIVAQSGNMLSWTGPKIDAA